MKWWLAAVVMAWTWAASARAEGPAARLTCPLDGAATFPIGSDGNPASKTYTDLEVPSQAYTNLVVACPKCGYAGWAGDFQSSPDGGTASYVRGQLAATAARAGSDPVWAYKHFLAILEYRRAPLRERLGATLFYSYVLKRRRPNGGQDPAMERDIAAVRRLALELLTRALAETPPKTTRGRLEWTYLRGELLRLVGEPKAGRPLLDEVCQQREEAGYLVGRMACEMAGRAAKGEAFEDYRDGLYDVTHLPVPKAPKPAEADKPAEGKTPEPTERPAEPGKPLPPMQRPTSPAEDQGAPPPPPPAK
jgi:hypothetical protein